jgi:hypothetical protein
MGRENKLNVYIAHAKFLHTRAQLVDNLVGALGAARRDGVVNDVKMVTEMDPNELRPEDVVYVTAQPIEDGPQAIFNGLLKPMTITQVSNALKHRHILQQIASGADDVISLVLEDDVMFVDGISQQLAQAASLYEQRPEPRGVAFLGFPGPRPEEGAGAKLINVMDIYKLLPGCDSFLVDAPSARTLLAEYAKVRFANNVQLMYALQKTNLAASMMVPNIFMDGTKYGIFHSTIELNGRLIYNPNFIALSEAIRVGSERDGGLSAADHDAIRALFEQAPHKAHVEYFYLKARYETARGKYHYARAIFQFAHALSKHVGIPLTQGSEFMKDYMKIFRYLQDVPTATT